MARRVTLQDVAAHAGVSRAAASLALRGNGRLSQETRERILRSMDELGYVYNRTAAALREKDGRLIGVVVTNVDNFFFAQSVQSIEDELERLGYSSFIGSSLRSRERQDRVLRSMQEFGVAGVILAAVEDTVPEVARSLGEAGIACLSYTRYVEDGSVDYVGPDDVGGGRLAASHLLGHGARRLAYIGGRRPSSASRMRRAGVEAELEAAGLGGTLTVVSCEMNAAGGFAAGRELLARGELPEAIVCVSDTVAFGLYRALRDAGAADRTRVIGFDDVELATYWTPRLTTVSSRPTELGRMAAAGIVDRLADPHGEPRVRYLEPDLVIRESCGCTVG
jgi:LacI family transcriptional regulator